MWFINTIYKSYEHFNKFKFISPVEQSRRNQNPVSFVKHKERIIEAGKEA
jgi:hypothetical protein